MEDDESAQGILYGGPSQAEGPGLRMIWQPLECDKESEQDLLGASRVPAQGVGRGDGGGTGQPPRNATTHVQTGGESRDGEVANGVINTSSSVA